MTRMLEAALATVRDHVAVVEESHRRLEAENVELRKRLRELEGNAQESTNAR